MSNNDNNIEKRSFEAFVNAIGSEIEQAQVRLISAANAQMLFHYWKMGNYILYHQNRQGWGGKVIKRLAQAIRFSYPEKKGYSVRNLAYTRKERIFGQELGLYVPVRTLLSIGRITKFHRNRYEVTYPKCAENHG